MKYYFGFDQTIVTILWRERCLGMVIVRVLRADLPDSKATMKLQ